MNNTMQLDLITDNTSPLTPDGRFGRITFLAWNLLIAFMLVVVVMILLVTMPHTFEAMWSNRDSTWVVLLAWIPNLIWFYAYMIFSIKRLHDMNQSAWLSILNCIPLINLFFGLYLSFFSGTAGHNNYGYPRETKTWENVLAVIYMVVLSVLLLIFIFAFGQISNLLLTH